MKKIIIFMILFILFSSYCFSQAASVNITVEITNVVINDGKVYLAIFANAESFRKEEPMLAFELEPNNTVVSQVVSLPAGDYVISGFQDANNNQKLDYRLLGIPRELVAISNYDGKGIPTKNFDKQKIPINSTTGKVTIGLYKF
jgi:uncharacterized protein (DUF2141 family)